MRRRKPKRDPERWAKLMADVERQRAARGGGYRERALALFPHVCARCGREFSGKDLRELTVHHKDNNHMNNPPDGSNWELLCIYCHAAAHDEYEGGSSKTVERHGDGRLGFSAFEGLKDLVNPEDEESKPQ